MPRAFSCNDFSFVEVFFRNCGGALFDMNVLFTLLEKAFHHAFHNTVLFQTHSIIRYGVATISKFLKMTGLL